MHLGELSGKSYFIDSIEYGLLNLLIWASSGKHNVMKAHLVLYCIIKLQNLITDIKKWVM